LKSQDDREKNLGKGLAIIVLPTLLLKISGKVDLTFDDAEEFKD
jgi:hypothetical protein